MKLQVQLKPAGKIATITVIFLTVYVWHAIPGLLMIHLPTISSSQWTGDSALTMLTPASHTISRVTMPHAGNTANSRTRQMTAMARAHS